MRDWLRRAAGSALPRRCGVFEPIDMYIDRQDEVDCVAVDDIGGFHLMALGWW